MSGFAVKGWCPGAWRPMMAGDGLLVRVRPRLGRLSREQALGLCAAAIARGNGQIDATSRAGLQLRGVREESWPPLVEALIALGLIDPDPARDARGNILVAPDWRAGDDAHRIAEELMARLEELPDLPAKIGFAIDGGPAPMLMDDPGDFRIERAATGGLILRAAGRPAGAALAPGTEVTALIAFARWFATHSADAGRMDRYHGPLPDWAAGTIPPAAAAAPLHPGRHAMGLALGLPFGRVAADALAALIERSNAPAIRITPWRILILEGVTATADASGFIADPTSPLLATDACVGAPACPQASVATRDLARRLAPYLTGRLHVSGCAKGCAHAGPAAVTITGRDGRFDLGFDGRAGDAPAHAGLDAAQVLAFFGAV